ncbi:MAG: hypothetical protein ACOH2N_14995 [Devosia sp.]
MTFPFAKFVHLQVAAAQSLGYHDQNLAEAIMHHCAMKVASATAPTDDQLSQYVNAEIEAKHRFLRMSVPDIEGVSLKGVYLRALSQCDEWELDHGTIDALVAGMIAEVAK